MAATDAKPVAWKNTPYRAYFPIRDVDGDLVIGAAGLDSERSLDGATFADCTNEATEIATSSGVYYLELTAAEMNTDCTAVNVKTSTTDAKTTTLIFYPEEAGDVRVKMTALGLDVFLGAFPELGILDSGTATSATATTLQGRAAAIFPDNVLIGSTVWAWGATQGYWQMRVTTGYVGSTDTHTVPTWDVTPSGLITYIVFGTAPGTGVVQTGDAFARLGAPAGPSVSADIAAIEAQTDDIGAAGAGLTAVPWNAAWDAEVQSEATDALNAYDPPTNAEVASAISAALTATIADSIPADGTRPSIQQGIYMLVQFMLDRSVSGTTATVKKPDGSTTLFTLTLNSATLPTSVTRST